MDEGGGAGFDYTLSESLDEKQREPKWGPCWRNRRGIPYVGGVQSEGHEVTEKNKK